MLQGPFGCTNLENNNKESSHDRRILKKKPLGFPTHFSEENLPYEWGVVFDECEAFECDLLTFGIKILLN